MTIAFPPKTILVGGIPIGVLNRREWASHIAMLCQTPRGAGHRPKLIFAANGQVVSLYATDPEFRTMFQQADAVTADGQPLVWASQLTSSPLPERAATTDLFHDVARIAGKADLSFYMLGATERNSSIAEARIRKIYPELNILGRRNGYFSQADEAEIVTTLNALKPDVLWVGLGVKKQAEFVVRNAEALHGVGCIVTCGGLFDYFTPEIKRAPRWMQKFSLEWLFRTWQEPRKYFMRYLITNPAATFLLLTRTRSQ